MTQVEEKDEPNPSPKRKHKVCFAVPVLVHSGYALVYIPYCNRGELLPRANALAFFGEVEGIEWSGRLNLVIYEATSKERLMEVDVSRENVHFQPISTRVLEMHRNGTICSIQFSTSENIRIFIHLILFSWKACGGITKSTCFTFPKSSEKVKGKDATLHVALMSLPAVSFEGLKKVAKGTCLQEQRTLRRAKEDGEYGYAVKVVSESPEGTEAIMVSPDSQIVQIKVLEYEEKERSMENKIDRILSILESERGDSNKTKQMLSFVYQTTRDRLESLDASQTFTQSQVLKIVKLSIKSALEEFLDE